MEFRLTYEGPLLAASRGNSRGEHKHEIRRRFHPQLAELWNTFPALQAIKITPRYGQDGDATKPEVELIATKFEKCGYRFVPLVTEHQKLSCELDILFLRREAPGAIVQGGDLDNRLKTLLDALKVPKEEEIKGPPVQPDEQPYFFCLLEDDNFISRLSVTADRLLEPAREEERESNVKLIISVKVKATEVTAHNLPLIS